MAANCITTKSIYSMATRGIMGNRCMFIKVISDVAVLITQLSTGKSLWGTVSVKQGRRPLR